MNHEITQQTLEYLRENLKISISGSTSAFCESRTIKVDLMLEGEVISSDYTEIPNKPARYEG